MSNLNELDQMAVEMVAEAINSKQDQFKDSLNPINVLASELFPKIGVEVTDETKRAFSAGFGCSVAAKSIRGEVNKMLASLSSQAGHA